MNVGEKIKVQLKAKLSYGTRSNPIKTKKIETIGIDYFTFKGGKTEYRICGDEIYSITGNQRFYNLIK